MASKKLFVLPCPWQQYQPWMVNDNKSDSTWIPPPIPMGYVRAQYDSSGSSQICQRFPGTTNISNMCFAVCLSMTDY